MTGKGAEAFKGVLADLSVKAIKQVIEEEDGKICVDLDNVKVEKKEGGSIGDTELIQGIIIDKERVHPGMPRKVNDARIALLDAAMEIKETETDAKIQITDPEQLQKFITQEENMLKNMVDTIAKTNANVVFCQKGIDDMAQHFLSKANIFAVRRVKESDMEKLSKATGGRIVTNIDMLTSEDLGEAEDAGHLVFVPLGGSSLDLWVSRLRGLNRPEYYLMDRDNPPPADTSPCHRGGSKRAGSRRSSAAI